MTSNGDLNASLDPPRSPRNDSGDAAPPAPKAASPSAKGNVPVTQDGDHDDNESEAETVVLSRDDDSNEKKVIKTERDQDEPARLDSIKENTHSHSPQNGRRRSSDVKDAKSNGHAKDDSDDAMSPVPTSPSTGSRQTKDTSPVGSPGHPTLSPTQTTTRGRSASTIESRKRKLRDEFGKLEPPRQKAKTEGLKDRTQPNSPATVRISHAFISVLCLLTFPSGSLWPPTQALAIDTVRYFWCSRTQTQRGPRAGRFNRTLLGLQL